MRQNWQVLPIPTRAQIEAKQLQKLQSQVKEALTGERLASFLPIVRELSEEYDAQAIAAAALQIAYDQTCPAWLHSEADMVDEDMRRSAKPKLRSGRRDSDRTRRSSRGRSDSISDDKRPVPKPKRKIISHENPVSEKQIGSAGGGSRQSGS